MLVRSNEMKGADGCCVMLILMFSGLFFSEIVRMLYAYCGRGKCRKRSCNCGFSKNYGVYCLRNERNLWTLNRRDCSLILYIHIRHWGRGKSE